MTLYGSDAIALAAVFDQVANEYGILHCAANHDRGKSYSYSTDRNAFIGFPVNQSRNPYQNVHQSHNQTTVLTGLATFPTKILNCLYSKFVMHKLET